MELGEKVKALLTSQKDILKEYEEVLREINANDSMNENIELRKELERLTKELEEAQEKIQKLSQENISVKIALKDQMMSERNHLLNASKKKIELYFKDGETRSQNRLLSVENMIRYKLQEINKTVAAEIQEEQEEVGELIGQIKENVDQRIKVKREKINSQYQEAMDEMDVAYKGLGGEISEEVLTKRKKHNDIEVNIGLNWINKIGIILLLFGVAAAMKYTYSNWFNDYMKGISGFLLGGVMLGIGEYFNKKDKSLFAMGLCGGGIGTLYLTVFSSYFLLEILNLPMSMILSVLITIVAFVLSQRYNSKTIAGISLLGGYLPFFSYGLMMGLDGTAIYLAMGYLLILNLLVLIMAFQKRWIFINYLSFLLNIPCLIYILYENYWVGVEVVGILYALLTFAMYLGITLAYPIREKVKLKAFDIALLGVNTFINCAIVYLLFQLYGFERYNGFLALIYALGYLGLSRFIHHQSSQESHVEDLFSITALTFAILMIPFQFGIEWATIGWLVEGVIILAFAKKRGTEKIEIGGWVILTLCGAGFFWYEFWDGWDVRHFVAKYSAITFALTYVVSLYIAEYKKKEILRLFKYFTILNTWVYLLRMSTRAYNLYLVDYLPSYHSDFYRLIIMAVITIVFAYGLPKIRAIKDSVVVGISVGLLTLSNLMCIILNFQPIATTGTPAARWIGACVLLIYNILVILSIKDITMQVIKKKSLSIEYYPLVLVIYLLATITVLLTNQLDLANINLVISMAFVLFAFSSIIFGFNKNYLLIRRFGLGLSIFATAKLFIFDLRYLEGINRIVAYFCFGLVLLGISFVYQRLRNNQKEVEAHGENY